MRTQSPQTFSHGVVVRGHHAAFPAGDHLDRMKAENGGVSKCAADRASEVMGTYRVRRVSKYAKAVAVRQRADLLKVTGPSPVVYGDDHMRQAALCLGPGELFAKGVDRQVARLRICVDKVHRRTAVQGAVGRSNKAVRAGPDTTARPHAHGQTRQMQPAGGVGDGDRVRHRVQLGERQFEGWKHRALCEEV